MAYYWRDEEEKDAIYAVYLRKLRYHTPRPRVMEEGYNSYSDSDIATSSIQHLQWETVKEKVIKAGSPKKLVQCLVTETDELDRNHFSVFFNTYRTFTTSQEVVNILLAMYQDAASKKRHNNPRLDTIRSTLHFWLDNFPQDFRDNHSPQPCLTILIDFCSSYFPHLKDTCVKAIHLREEIKKSSLRTQHIDLDRKESLLASVDDADRLLESLPRLPDLVSIDSRYVAEQLTYWDAELFKRLIPYQCLACWWNRRHEKDNHQRVSTVMATIEQFNAITTRVISVILKPNVRFTTRAKHISKWIDILKELRLLKNYSSLKAVLSALNSEPVHRLKCVWIHVSKSRQEDFEELSMIFSEQQNAIGVREILEKEGTAKSAALPELGTKLVKKIQRYSRSKSDLNDMSGTVPYLGIFLTDLTMIDTAFADKTANGLINFEKRRREFEILTQIKLLQAAAQNYHIAQDPKFRAWFAKLPCLTEKEWYERSYDIEKPLTATPDLHRQKRRKKARSMGSLSSLSQLLLDMSNMSNCSGSPKMTHKLNGVANGERPQPPERMPSVNAETPMSNGSFASSGWWPSSGQTGSSGSDNASQFDAMLYHSWLIEHSPVRPEDGRRRNHDFKSRSLTPNSMYRLSQADDSNGSMLSAISSRSGTPEDPYLSHPAEQYQPEQFDDFYIVRVSLDHTLQTELAYGNLYKCVKLENVDKTKTFIAKALMKHMIQGDPNDYSMVQILPHGEELVLPDRENAYYAVSQNSASRVLYCVLKPKHLTNMGEQTTSKNRLRELKRKKKPSPLSRWNSGFL